MAAASWPYKPRKKSQRKIREAIVGPAADKGISVDAAVAAVFIRTEWLFFFFLFCNKRRTKNGIKGFTWWNSVSSFGDLAKTGKSDWSALDVAERRCPIPFQVFGLFPGLRSF